MPAESAFGRGADRQKRKDRHPKKVVSLISCLIVVGSMGIAEAREASRLVSGQGCSAITEVQTLQMEVKAQKVVVRSGDTARFLVTVTRGVDGTDAPRHPAADAKVWVVLSPELRPVWDLAVTDETGAALLSIRIPKSGLQGWVDGVGHASVSYGEEPCRTVEEVDRWEQQRILKIT